MNRATDTAARSETLRRILGTLQAGWQRLPITDRRVIATSAVIAVGLLMALAQTCQESVARGQRFRGEQRQMVGAAPPAVSPAVVHIAAAAATGVTGL